MGFFTDWYNSREEGWVSRDFTEEDAAEMSRLCKLAGEAIARHIDATILEVLSTEFDDKKKD